MERFEQAAAGEASSLPSSRQRRNHARMGAYNARKADANGPNENGRMPSQEWSYSANEPAQSTGGKRRQTKRPKGDGPTGKPVLPPRRKPPQDSVDRDEPMFELDDLATLVPDHRINEVNLEYSGFVTLVEESYRSLSTADSRLTRQLTLGSFLHVMTEYLWTRIYILQRAFQKSPIGGEEFDFERLISLVHPETALMPQEIHEYLRGLGEYRDGYGNTWRPHLPAPATLRHRTAATPGGTFAPLAAANHNIYECYISPFITRSRVEAELAQAAAFDPAVPGRQPDTFPSIDLLGWVPAVQAAHPDARARIADITWAMDNVGSRLQHSQALQDVVQNVLSTLEDKRKIATGIPDSIEGSTALLGFVMSEDPDGLALRRSQITVQSISRMTPSEIGQMALFTYRRKRSEDRPGFCYTRANGEAIAGWLATRDYNFEGIDPFNIPAHTAYHIADDAAFRLACQNDRTGLVGDWIRDKMPIKREPHRR